MSRTGPLSETWRCALLGGVASIPLTVGLYWLSGAGNELSLNMVFVGGLLAGVLAQRRSGDVGSAGFRAGVVGGLPGLWILAGILEMAATVSGPLAFRVVAGLLVAGTFAAVMATAAGVAGFLGAKVGAWLAAKDVLPRLPIADN